MKKNANLSRSIKELAVRLTIKFFDHFNIKIIRKKIRVDETTASNSYIGEQGLILKYLDKIAGLNKYCVDIGASDGVTMSNTFPLFKNGWPGLAVECDSRKFIHLSVDYQYFSGVKLIRNKVTPKNVLDILGAGDVPLNFGFLSLDIDGYDYFILEKILTKFRPAMICAEINENIPAPIKFTVKYDPNFSWATDHFFGQSISQLALLAEKTGYDLIELYYNNAFLVDRKLNFTKPLTAERAYRQGYLDQPDRKEKFSLNKDVEAALNLSPDQAVQYYNDYFKKYQGKFTISL
jgi:hypothetical protein